MKYSTLSSARNTSRTAIAPSLLGRFIAWQNRMHERAFLYNTMQGMDEHILRDIGISRAELDSEVTKPFWRV